MKTGKFDNDIEPNTFIHSKPVPRVNELQNIEVESCDGGIMKWEKVNKRFRM